MLCEYDVIVLLHAQNEVPIAAGTRGTILIDHNTSPPAYEVEFVDEAGKSLGIFSILGKNMQIASDA